VSQPGNKEEKMQQNSWRESYCTLAMQNDLGC
jgi:hypothetical protein